MEYGILTKKEMEAIKTKMLGLPMSQEESNRLSRFVRPKLRIINEIEADYLLKRLRYNPASLTIDKRIIRAIDKSIDGVKSITLFGSIIQNGYQDYRDIDVLVVIKKRNWKNNWEKLKILSRIEENCKKEGLNLDLQLTDERSLKTNYVHSPSLIYQLSDRKTIYGKLHLPRKTKITKLDLRMKLDWSEPLVKNPSSEEIYNCLRNTVLVKLMLAKIVNNWRLDKELIERYGENLILNLKNGLASPNEKRLAIEYLNKINKDVLNSILEAKWEKIEL